MKTRNSWRFVLAAFFCGALFCAQASAKVCFVGEENCSGGGSFDDYKDPGEEGKVCTDEGYILKSACDADPSRHVTGYCPYNNDYVMCCGNEYVYDSCVYPHVTVDKCGSKFKCKCDPEKYPYTEEACHSKFKFSNPGGTACTQIDAGSTSTIKTLYYSACLCERGLYPYSKDDCQTTANADVNGDPCQDSMGNQYWDSCKCSNPPYKWESVDCEFGGKGKACVQGGVYFFQECCSCAAFPAEGERGGEPNDTHATKWTTCDCPRKGRFRITQCEAGWQPNKDGSACERISCENAVKLFFMKHPNTDYGVFNGSKLVGYAKLTDAEIAKLPEAQQTYAVGAEIENTKATKGVLAKNVTAADSYSSGLGGTKAKTIYSGAYFGTTGYTSDHKMVQEACGTYEPEKTVVPTLYISNYFSSSLDLTVYGSELYFSGTDREAGALTLYNTDVEGKASFRRKLTLKQVDNMPNSEPEFGMYSSEFKDGIEATGYNFDIGSMYIETESWGGEGGKFTFKAGNVFNGGTVYVYPSWGTSGEKHYYERKVSGYLTFVGPSDATPANVYTNVRIGYEGYGYDGQAQYDGTGLLYSTYGWAAPGMEVRLSGNLIWNMYNGKTNYVVGTTPESTIYSTDYGSGNYAKIKYSSNGYWKWCKGLTQMLCNDHRKHTKLCTGSCSLYNESKPYTDGYWWFSTINKDKKQTLEHHIRYISRGIRSRCGGCDKLAQAVDWNQGRVYVVGHPDVYRDFSDCGN